MGDSCGAGHGLNNFKVWVYLCLIYWWGDVSRHDYLRNLPNISVLLGDNSSPGPCSPKTSVCVGISSVCICTRVCACAHRDRLNCHVSILF